MKKRLKGLLSFVLAALMLATPALAAYEENEARVYTGTEPLVEGRCPEGISFKSIDNLVIGAPLNGQPAITDITDGISNPGYDLTGWKLWTYDGDSLYDPSNVMPLNGTVTQDEYDDRTRWDNLLIEPLWEKYRISQQPSAENGYTVGVEEYTETTSGSGTYEWGEPTPTASYQWYEVKTYDVVDTVIDPATQKSASNVDTNGDKYSAYVAGRWVPDGDFFFQIELEAGDVLTLTPKSPVDYGEFYIEKIEEYDNAYAEEAGGVYTVTAPAAGEYAVYGSYDMPPIAATVVRRVAVDSQTDATLANPAPGKTYSCTIAFEDDTKLTSDRVEIPSAPAVTFDANGGRFSDGTKSKRTEIANGSVTEPDGLSWGNYTFEGWYTDRTYATEFTNSGLSVSVTVYAKWTNAAGSTVRTTALDLSSQTSDASNADEGWSWVQSTKTLTLDDAIIDCSGFADCDYAVRLPDGAIISLAEGSASTVNSGTGFNACGVYVEGSAAILGDGSLSVEAGRVGEVYGAYGVDCDTGDKWYPGTLTIGSINDSPNVTVTAGKAYYESCGVIGEVTVSGGSLTAVCGEVNEGLWGDCAAIEGGLTTTGAVVSKANSDGSGENVYTGGAKYVLVTFTDPLFEPCNRGAPTTVKPVETPTREPYTFGGWYTGTDGAGTKLDENDPGVKGVTYYARWKNAAGNTVRTTRLKLTPHGNGNADGIGEANLQGSTYADGVYTNAAEGWTWYQAASGGYATNTLVLNGFSIDCDFGGSTYSAIHLPGNSTIVLADGSANTVKASGVGGSVMGIWVNGSSGSILGNGSLSVEAIGDSEDSSCYGIYFNNNTAVAAIGSGEYDPTVIVTAGDAEGYSYGVRGNVTVSGGNFIAACGDVGDGLWSAFAAISGTLTAEGAVIKASTDSSGAGADTYKETDHDTYKYIHASLAPLFDPCNDGALFSVKPSPAPTREGYIFGGWYTEKDGGGTELVTGEPGEIGVVYYAKWTPNLATAPTISSVTGATLTYGDGGSVSVSATAAEGHEITGYQWYSNTSNSNTGGTMITTDGTSAIYNIPADKDAGTHYYYCVVTATRTDNGHTKTAASPVATVSIAKKPVAARWTELTHVYDGTAKSPTFGFADADIIEGDRGKVGAILSGDQRKTNAGSYTVTAALEGTSAGDRSHNYSLTNPTGYFIIQKAPVTFTVSDNSVQYGSTLNVLVTPDVAGFTAFTVSYKDGSGDPVANPTDVGTYDIFAVITSANHRHAGAADGAERKIGVLTIYAAAAPEPATYTVSFDGGGADGGSPVTAMTGAQAGAVRILPTCSFTHTGKAFTGWGYGGKVYQPGDRFEQPAADVSLTAQWQSVYRIGGVVNRDGSPLSGVVVTLMLGSKQMAQTTTGINGVSGAYSFTDVPPGIYNLVASRDGVTQTVLVEITSSNVLDKTITMPEFKTSSVVEVAAGSPAIVVGNLENSFESADKAEGKTVELKLNASATSTVNSSIEDEATDTVGLYLEVTLTKTVNGQAQTLTEVPKLLKLVIQLPGELQGKASYTVYRTHDKDGDGKPEVDTLTTTPNGDGEYIEVNADKTAITVYAKYFSTYAIAYAESSAPIIITKPVVETPPLWNPFSDVNEQHWFHDDVKYVFEKGLMEGMSDTLFSPTLPVTRAMMVTVLWRMEGEPVINYAMSFNDVPEDEYYTEAVRWAAGERIVEGHDSKTFAPLDAITREQMAALLWRYAAFKGHDVSAAADLSQYTDADKISPWALDAMRWANAEGLINGVANNLLDPLGHAQRCQAAAILHRFCEIYQ